MSDLQVTCITKPHTSSQHDHITHLGNPPTWILTREQVIAHIDAKTHTFFVRDSHSGKRSEVGVVREHGKAPYLRTYADGVWNNNLLAQNQCPLRY